MPDYVEGVDFIPTKELRDQMRGKRRSYKKSHVPSEKRIEAGKRAWEKRKQNLHNEGPRHPVISHKMEVKDGNSKP